MSPCASYQRVSWDGGDDHLMLFLVFAELKGCVHLQSHQFIRAPFHRDKPASSSQQTDSILPASLTLLSPELREMVGAQHLAFQVFISKGLVMTSSWTASRNFQRNM
ncbi:hypothetical protein J5N97_014575 [Dioscorea zingiberensis]|uniref:Uncharacterized protein n=1 Tax=Dioscorea zingiberensis TaxID=325984 RepID=A0A9D5CSR0_9LILI|nr:hypothetical protein J5N97_014575 [Dioscorea zingiberensis]